MTSLLGGVPALALMIMLTAAPTAAQTWNAGTGTWSTAANWTPATVPNSGGASALVNNGGTANVNGGFTVGTLTIGNTSTVGLLNSTSLAVNSGIANGGILSLNSVGNVTDLIIGTGTINLTGGGAVTLSDTTANRIYGGAAGAILNNVNNTISGAGQIGVNANLSIVNAAAGVIDANQTSALTFGAGISVTNNGTLRATGTGGLTFTGGSVADSTGGGQIQANGAGAHVDLQNATFKGGTLSTSGGGLIQTTSTGILDGTGSAVTIATGSTVLVNNNTSLTLFGTITNQGSIALNSVGNVTDLIAGGGTVTLTGGGAVTLSNTSANRIYGGAAGAILNNVNNTISGAGQIGVNANLSIVNAAAGVIDANQTNALTFDAGISVTNNGTLRATGAGGLSFTGGSVADGTGGGQIEANGAGAHVDLQNATFKGGTLSTSGGGVIQTTTTGILDGSGSALTIATGSTVLVNNNTSLTVLGTITNQGTIAMNSVGNVTDMVIGANGAVLQGGGAITLSDAATNRIYSNTAGALLQNVDNTISGAGQLFPNAGMILKNDTAGVINATGTAALTINGFGASNPVQNRGLLESTSGTGGLAISGAVIDNTGNSNAGRIIADGAGTHVDVIAASTIRGGTLTGQNGGVINVSNSTLDGSGAGAPINIAGGTPVVVGNNQFIVLNGTITNQGTIALNSVGNVTDMVIGANGAVLQGGGAITLSSIATNRIYSNTAGAVLQNVDNTISGAGQIGVNANLSIINAAAGVIDANQTSALTFGAGISVTNNGTLRATGAGGLSFTGGSVVDGTGGGQIQANGAGAHVDLQNATFKGGTLSTSGGGLIQTTSTGILDGTGSAVTIATGSTVLVNNNTNLTVLGTITNQGTIAMNSVGNVTDMVIGANGAVLQGGGAIVLSNTTANRIYSKTAGAVLDNVDNTISGAGQIFTNVGLSLVNSGVVDATRSSALAMGLDITNNASGILRGSGAGGLTINAATTTNNGTIEALNGSAVTFNGSSVLSNNTGGTLTGGTYRAVSTGGGATVSLVGGSIVTNAANLVLDGAGSKIQAGTAGSYTDIQSSLTTNTSGGQLHVLNGQNYTTVNNISNAGLINLGGGTFTSTMLSNTGTVSGFGNVGGAVKNQAMINGDGPGGITLSGAVSGAGSYAGIVTFSGSLGPGNSPALISGQRMVFASTNDLIMEIGGSTRGTEYDAIDAFQFDLGGELSVLLLDLGSGIFSPHAGDYFDVLIAQDFTGDFSAFDFGLAQLASGLSWTHEFHDLGNGLEAYRLIVAGSPADGNVPEPGTFYLAILAMLVLGGNARRRWENSQPVLPESS